jgi:hypothetical protein
MRDLLVIGAVAVVAIVIGVVLFFFGPTKLQSDVGNALLAEQTTGSASTPYTVLEQGVDALSVTNRTNYRITSATDLATLWSMVYGDKGSVALPTIDFTQDEVLAILTVPTLRADTA